LAPLAAHCLVWWISTARRCCGNTGDPADSPEATGLPNDAAAYGEKILTAPHSRSVGCGSVNDTVLVLAAAFDSASIAAHSPDILSEPVRTVTYSVFPQGGRCSPGIRLASDRTAELNAVPSLPPVIFFQPWWQRLSLDVIGG